MFVVDRGQCATRSPFICQLTNQIRVLHMARYRLIPTQILLVNLVKRALDLVQEDTSSTFSMILLSSASLIEPSCAYFVVVRLNGSI